MQRILEKEIMDDKKNALAYAKADMSQSNLLFTNKLVQAHSKNLIKVLDIGCGTADIPIRLVKIQTKAHITAVDASDEMLKLAKDIVDKEKYDNQIKLVKAYLPGLPFPPNSFDAIVSNSLLHHLPNPMLFWEEIKLLGNNNSIIFVMDLLRPNSIKEAKEIVERKAGNENPILKEDFYNSLLAAFSLDEIKGQLLNAGLLKVNVEIVSDIHWVVSGSIN